ncbi:endolytic transglycosylase MltG [Sideroxydans sp. CL21]|uniref:endolytic transglycosylase MltG n=1 Tax=Sideroxydans sp. CL21 TaxID=2600596 RepID=UPI0012AA4A3D|nr:endolytic transglycosylase MltG [Sideroxydans sp. CL21]VVC83846.1 FIG004453: protein YceG like [Sideroxydans sp. CL21]
MSVIKELLLWLLFILIIVGGLFTYYARTPIPLEHTPFEFSLKQGSSLKSAAHQIQQSGGLNNELLFVLLARSLRKANQIKPGNYQLEHEVTPLQLLNMISKGQFEHSSLTIIEGTTFKELRTTLNAESTLRHDSATLSEAEILKRIGATESAAEGLFFPDTYNYSTGSSDLIVLKRAYQLMQRNLQDNWKKRDSDLPFSTPYEALTLASIVEKETGQPGDRPMIASVFINRLKKHMRLQTDPTVIYGMGDKFDGNLRKRDLTQDTPFNTYTRNGLTPTPIALPGLAALQATLHPAPSAALYFVARGDGSSQFSSTLIEHNNAVNQYQIKPFKQKK